MVLGNVIASNSERDFCSVVYLVVFPPCFAYHVSGKRPVVFHEFSLLVFSAFASLRFISLHEYSKR